MKEVVECLENIEMLSCLDRDEIEQLASETLEKSYDLGSVVLESGDPLQGMHLVKSGSVRLFTRQNGNEIHIASPQAGDTFGDIALLRKQRSEYCARSSAKTEILVIPGKSVQKLFEKNKAARQFVSRCVAFKVGGGFLSEMFNLGSKAGRDEIQDIVRSVGIREIPEKGTVYAQGSEDDRSLYLVRRGEIRLVRDENGTDRILRTAGPGEMFGENACLTNSPRRVFAVAAKDSVVLSVPCKTVRHILDPDSDLRLAFESRIDDLNREVERCRTIVEQQQAVSEPDGRGKKIIRRFSFVPQAESADCGAACLAMICRHYDVPVSVGKLRELAGTTLEGASMDRLAGVAESLGFVAKGYKCTYKTLRDFGPPFVAHLESQHYVVVYGVSGSHVWIADPASGTKKITVSEFETSWTGNCLVFDSPGDTDPAIGRSSRRRFLGYLKPFKKILFDLVLAAIIIQTLGLAPAVMIQNILDRVAVHQNHDLLAVMAVGLAIAMSFRHITGFLSAYLMHFMIRRLDFNMISMFYRHVLSLPLSFFATRKTGDIIARFHENNTVRRFMTEGSISTILNAMMIFTYLTVMFIYNVRLTMLLVCFLPPIILLTLLAAPKYRDYARRTFFAGAEAESLLVETLGGAEVVKGMGSERSMRMRWEKKYAKTLDLRYKAEIFTTLIGTASGVLRAAASITLLWVGTKMVLSQELTIGQLMAFNVLMGSVMTPVMGLVRIWDELQETLVSMERLGDVLDLESEQNPSEVPGKTFLPKIGGDIRFENVYFRYDEKHPYVLKNIDFSVSAGSTVAIVGESGSGKSTLAKLLMAFYSPSLGKIRVDGCDMGMLDIESYRKRIGYVMQSNSLFSGTVSENIAMGDPEPDPARIAEASRLADAGFIGNLPMGYSQVVGERGVGLSEGQVQRICIARALYRNPDLLIFDEATSSLDGESECRIQTNMGEILEGRTAFVIAHRLSTVMNADRILVLYDGAVAEQGTHDELYTQKGMYYHLVRKQTEGPAAKLATVK